MTVPQGVHGTSSPARKIQAPRARNSPGGRRFLTARATPDTSPRTASRIPKPPSLHTSFLIRPNKKGEKKETSLRLLGLPTIASGFLFFRASAAPAAARGTLAAGSGVGALPTSQTEQFLQQRSISAEPDYRANSRCRLSLAWSCRRDGQRWCRAVVGVLGTFLLLFGDTRVMRAAAVIRCQLSGVASTSRPKSRPFLLNEASNLGSEGTFF